MPTIQLTKGQEAIVSDEDVECLNQWKWSYGSRSYACRSRSQQGRQTSVLMHRVVVERMTGEAIPEGYEVDHINGDTLDNRRENLRLVSHNQNAMNKRNQQGSKSRFKGVSWHKGERRWRAAIWLDGETVMVGRFDDEEEAARAYDAKARAAFGEFARLNFPDEGVSAIFE
jgi:hypothetical protein